MKVGDKIKIELSNFSFGGRTPKNFDKHVKKSVPLYELGQNLICELSSFFLNKDSIIYDLGCSTGTTLKKIDEYNSFKTIKMYGIDKEKKMLKEARKKLKKTKNKVFLKHHDLTKIKFKKSDLIISYYTIQFLKPKYRQLLINKIFKSLNWGGAFIFFEKVRAPDARFQDMMTQIYNEYKADIGYDSNEIYNKSLSLRSTLEPFSSNANKDFLKRAGFKDIMTIQKYCSFEGFLAIK